MTTQMREVICIDTITVISVPLSYIECTICQRMRPLGDFCSKDDDKQTRTNCYSCYMKPLEEWKVIRKQVAETIKSVEYRNVKQEMVAKAYLKGQSISVGKLMEFLSTLDKDTQILLDTDHPTWASSLDYISKEFTQYGVHYVTLG